MRETQETAAQLDIAIDEILEDSGALPRGDDLVATARLLRDVLPRFHPRFSFEDHLASRLAGARASAPGPVGAEPIPIRPVAGGLDAMPLPHTEADWRRRGLVAGGAIASGVSLAIPLAGAALVVWRRSRSSGGLL